MNSTDPWRTEPIRPFGLLVAATSSGTELHELPPDTLQELLTRNRLVVLRGFTPLEGDALPAFCRRLGPLAEFEFGTVNRLQVDPEARNYLYTDRAVPFHWDGAFIGSVPRAIFFHCDVAPPAESGGETLFSDAVAIVSRAPAKRVVLWTKVQITYSTQKVVHYGGTFTSPLLTLHPSTGERTLRFAEPVEDLNPVRLEIHGLPHGEEEAFLSDLSARLRSPDVCYAHSWRDGDVLIADNHALLHGRSPLRGTSRRRIRRVNIL